MVFVSVGWIADTITVTSHPDIINQSINIATGRMEHGTISAET